MQVFMFLYERREKKRLIEYEFCTVSRIVVMTEIQSDTLPILAEQFNKSVQQKDWQTWFHASRNRPTRYVQVHLKCRNVHTRAIRQNSSVKSRIRHPRHPSILLDEEGEREKRACVQLLCASPKRCCSNLRVAAAFSKMAVGKHSTDSARPMQVQNIRSSNGARA